MVFDWNYQKNNMEITMVILQCKIFRVVFHIIMIRGIMLIPMMYEFTVK